jgi:thiamine kinase-like enzyme
MDDASLSAQPDASQVPRDNLGQIVEQLEPELGRSDGSPEPLSGGITNRNYRATLGGKDYVIRVPGKDTSLLGIDRQAECEANRAAAEIGIAAPVAAMLSDPQAIVTDFIEGRAMDPGELRDGEALAGAAEALRTMHAAPPISAEFDSFRIVEEYERVARGLGVEIPSAYEDAHAHAEEIEAALSGDEHEPVPCHNDLLAANFIWDGLRVRIVDWEYAGMGDRYFDLANFAVNNELPTDSRRELLGLYLEAEPTPRQDATLYLFTFMSDFREAMWGVVQQGASDIEFDFADYAAKHFRRLNKTAEAPEFSEALEAARGD